MMFDGQCFCGSVKFTVSAPTKWCAHCHCTICQRIHGSGVVTWLGCIADSVKIEDKNNCLIWFESTSGAERGSCRQCTTHLFFRSVNWPDELHITRTSFSGELDREPEVHAHHSTHVNWLTYGDDLPTQE